ncbi:MAG: adenylate/guanylate cyclase domain-containing protein [Gammaproteobacteria bacterium]
MRWWAHSTLRTKIFLAFSALILAVLLATLWFTQLVVSREAQRTLTRELLTTGQVFDRLLKERATRLQTNSILLASDFALKRVIATHFDGATYDADTLASATLNYQRRIGVELFWITDESGVLLAVSEGTSAALTPGRSIADLSPLREALQTQEAASAITEIDGRLFQVAAVPVFGPDVIGVLLLGHVIDNALAERLKQDTGSDISFLTETRVFASSWPQDRWKHFLPSGATRAAVLSRPEPRPISLLNVAGEQYLSLAVPVEAQLPHLLYALVQGSYDKELAPLRNLRLRIALIGTVALGFALLVVVGLAGGIIGPVKTLVAGMHEVLKGNLHYRSKIDRQDEIGFLARSFNEMVVGLEEREHIKDTFGRFVSRDVAEAVLEGRIPLEGERRDVSILFQDIRGFTALSEKLDPTALLRVLNQLFTEVVAAVEAEGGVVKQFTGDGVMALFGAPQMRADHPERAVRAALGIVSRLTGLNVALVQQGVPALQIGIGIHTGDVIAGLIGPDERVEYGVVGEPVNLASRVEALTKELPAIILVSRQIASRLGPEFELGRTALLPVKGKTQPVEVVEVLAMAAK